MIFKILLLIAAIQDAPVSGPLTEALERRFDKFSERVEAWQNGNTLVYQKLEQAQANRFAEVIAEIRSLKEDRSGLLSQLAEFRQDRDGLLSRMQTLRAEILANRDEMASRWTPFQNLVDRLTALVWKLVLLCISVLVAIVVLGAIGLFLYGRLRAKITSLAIGKLP